ncbi:imm11 family protein [Marinicellulosiphila megalodicopiae]|uniref:imm11 family protein n=1 Tax=Marinicellulosiphila megalodicopiae TaxID=2724896 RepID=UPI003BB10AAF
MSKYDEEYYVLRRFRDDESIPSLAPDKNTNNRGYTIGRVEGNSPLVFFNSIKDYQLQTNLEENIGEILFDSSYLLISDKVYKKIVLKNLPLDFTPAIYIDNKEKWHEEYWYVRVTKNIDCWCREHSEYSKKSIEATGAHHIYCYVLDEKVLDKIEEKDRLIFEMDKSAMGDIVIHKSLMEELLDVGCAEENFTLISEYEG